MTATKTMAMTRTGIPPTTKAVTPKMARIHGNCDFRINCHDTSSRGRGASVRQNLVPLVAGGRPTPQAASADWQAWGSTHGATSRGHGPRHRAPVALRARRDRRRSPGLCRRPGSGPSVAGPAPGAGRGGAWDTGVVGQVAPMTCMLGRKRHEVMNVSADEYPVPPPVVGVGAVFVEHRLKEPQGSEP